MPRAGWILYGVAFVAFVVVMWKRIGAWDRARDELEHRRTRSR